jgi:hypothetical protein
MPELTKDAKEELALALLLWKDFKIQDSAKDWFDFVKQMYFLADTIGVRTELDELVKKAKWPFKITMTV